MLKKIALTLALVALASSAFAAASAFTAMAPPSGINFAPSKNVTLGYQGDTGGGAGSVNVVYTIGSKNTAGDKIFATTSATTAIVFKTGLAGTALQSTDGTAPPATPSDSSYDSSFSIL